MPDAPLLEARDLRKRFDDVEADAGVSFTILEGESVGIVG